MDEIEQKTKLFVQLAEERLPPFDTLDTTHKQLLVLSYYEQLKHMADRLNIPFDVERPESKTSTDIENWINDINTDIATKRIYIALSKAIGDESVSLDSAWRDKIHSYIFHIRTIVTRAKDLTLDIQEKILARLADFEKTVDWQRTPIDRFNAAFREICVGVSSGAKELGHAVRLGERIIGALGRLWVEPPILVDRI